MNEKNFNSTVQNLKFNIGNDIAYTYSSFVPEGTENKLLKLKCDILPADRSLLLNPAAAGNRFLCPYDVLTTRITRRIEDFYTDITFSAQTYTKLSRYGGRAKTFTAYFQKNLKASMQNTQRTLLRELDLQIMQNRTPKQITAYLNTILDRRMRNLRQLLQSSAGQMEQFMILWEYQDCGFNRYRYVAVGTTCEGCTALDGQIFSIDEAEPGVNFGTLHPHCDCKTEILDANGNAVYTISSVKKEEKQEKSDDSLKQYNFLSSYLGKSLRQLLMGNFTEDVTLLGTALQVIAGLLDLDLPLDLRDLAYDLTHWENTPKHIAQTAMDFLALLPVIGSLKYSDEVSAVLKTAAQP